jgi:hypothetical protein
MPLGQLSLLKRRFSFFSFTGRLNLPSGTDTNEARVLNLDALLTQQRMLLHCVNKAVNSGSFSEDNLQCPKALTS